MSDIEIRVLLREDDQTRPLPAEDLLVDMMVRELDIRSIVVRSGAITVTSVADEPALDQPSVDRPPRTITIADMANLRDGATLYVREGDVLDFGPEKGPGEKLTEEDERIQAWATLVEHPFFKRAFEMETAPLIENMVKLLDYEMDRTDKTTVAPAPDDSRLRELAMSFAVQTYSPEHRTTINPEEILAFLKGETSVKADPLIWDTDAVQDIKREAYQEVYELLAAQWPTSAETIRRNYLSDGGEG
jgi:hypothetical protein